ncbi:29894_t:CDS:2, partial [Gigaspora margarita]
MCEQSTPTTATTNSEKPTPTLAEFVRKYNTEQLIQFLRENEDDLQLSDVHFEILRTEEVTGRDFLNSTKQDFIDNGLKGGTAKSLADFAKEVREKKLKSLSSCKTEQEVKEIFNKFGYEDADITSILPFKPASELNEAERCHYISPIIHSSIHIARKITNKTIIPKCQFEVIGDERTGSVDYAIKVKDNTGIDKLIAITEAKQSDILMGFGQNVLQLTASHHKNSKKRNVEEAFGKGSFGYLYGIVTTERFYRIESEYSIRINKDVLKDDSELCKDVKKVVQVLVSLLKDRVEVDETPD